tara:strand:+ start:642 stop:761 length:120 start_codon:yes stop_codon:yes gene_type:complete
MKLGKFEIQTVSGEKYNLIGIQVCRYSPMGKSAKPCSGG